MNFTVSAYDELKMCKSRTQAVDPAELEDESEMESNLIISKYDVSIFNILFIYHYTIYTHVRVCECERQIVRHMQSAIIYNNTSNIMCAIFHIANSLLY